MKTGRQGHCVIMENPACSCFLLLSLNIPAGSPLFPEEEPGGVRGMGQAREVGEEERWADGAQGTFRVLFCLYGKVQLNTLKEPVLLNKTYPSINTFSSVTAIV
jgi:hypothetical protein